MTVGATADVATERARGRWRWLRALDANDPRYPRSKSLALLRGTGRAAWLPFSVFAGNVATGLVMAVAVGGLSVFVSVAGLVRVTWLAPLLALGQRMPLAAAAVGVAIVLLLVLARRAYVDARRESGVLRLRTMLAMLEARAARTMTAEGLRADLRALQQELEAGANLLRMAPVNASATDLARTQTAAPSETLRERVARLAEISAMLSQDLTLKALMDAMMEREMAAWERRQRMRSSIMGIASIALGGLIPVFTSAGILPGLAG